ncbi:urea carboxylase [Paenibacillus sp. LHD-117]|uniref:urea carboxylase n=1 Tax=Paenibacillus sp. LHD-117 TaxID=3071412 RepID=UPI0027DEAD9D|nr:urea carboxylase [Paenibacillus sp. LHD-117]MDQ6422814.1 urea carboxylase [Paenibacillus sp. LHD-117]
MFNKILIANRGAIAVRIERTLKRLGIASVAVYTKADQDSRHVDLADEAVLIGEGPAKESYLNASRILDIAERTGVQAIHPGYGFLSENADFARACRERGIAFIGPTPEQMEQFGLKHSAREIAGRAGVPMLSGTPLIEELAEALSAADRIGYPVMLKSTAGGGGIGMRVCADAEALQAAFEGVRHLAETNFKNGGVFLEKYIARARHVEVQIFGNRFGEVAALGERDCSVQRRNQKVLEESPAPNLPEDVRQSMFAAAKRLAAEVGYRSAGTVEFLYDPDACEFYFLEVNTRLQVEHGVTEEVLGIDLVEWMVREAADELTGLDKLVGSPQGHSIQARIYAEDCLQDFRPSAGQLDRAVFPGDARVETWVRDGMTVTTLYDPMLAKIIVRAGSREEALDKLSVALAETRFHGLTTNLSYLQALLLGEECRSGNVYTRMLNGFSPAEHALEVLDGGVQTTVQDYPGRSGYWDVGVPPSGPMDALSFRIGNRLLGNHEEASGLELTLRGGSYRFRDDIRFCVTGAEMSPKLDGQPVERGVPTIARRGETLTFGEAAEGMRAYLLVEGGFDMPGVLGSSSTFTLGGFGGYGGRALRTGDVLGVHRVPSGALIGWGSESNGRSDVTFAADLPPGPASDSSLAALKNRPALSGIVPMTREWTIGVVPGPHCTGEYLREHYLRELAETRFEVHFNSSRTGVRLIGPVPAWAREDGGEAGLHPSNIHDNAYAVGTLDLTGDMPILLGPDGPSLGGFVCPVTTATAELWKLGQLRPGDSVRFKLITLEQAALLRRKQEGLLNAIGNVAGAAGDEELAFDALAAMEQAELGSDYPLLVSESAGRRFKIVIRCAGDANLLVEYGEMELNLLLRFQAHALMEAIKNSGDIPVLDLTPGIRSLQVHYDPERIGAKEACRRILALDAGLPPLESMKVPSRVVRLPLSWDDPETQLAIERYQNNVRPDAPWCPSNLEFIRRMNGLDGIEDVMDVVYNANYLVLGLGDVYLGAPVATPLDPRHRLVTTKYNPARTWTPENAVGIGGAYMCVYGMEGPGGYQFVGRTIQMWNKLRETESFKPGSPWLLRFFDQIRFYPVEADELLQLREDFLRGRFEADIVETTFDLGEYLTFLDSIGESAGVFKAAQQAAFREERERWRELGIAEYVSEQESATELREEAAPEGAVAVRCSMPGSVWKVKVEPGQRVERGEVIVVEESMKMEFAQEAPCSGIIDSIFVKPGDEVQAGQLLAYILEESGVLV